MTQYNGLYKFKRVISVIMAMAVLLMMTPVWGRTADSAETGELEHNHDGWMLWDSTNSLPNTAGSYYLAGNVSGSWTAPSGETNLCLNGNTISGGITVPSGATLSIYDEGSGKVTTSSTVITVQSGGKAYIYGGTYETSSSYAISVVSGGFIQIDSGTINGATRDGNATILIKGECIINNATVSGGSNAVYSQDYGKTYIYGGNFESTSYNSMAVQKNAYMYINMTNGGVISNNVSGKYAINVLGTAEIDYAITSGSSTAINVNSSASATINGGSFSSTSNDTVTNSGTLIITGGSFTGKQYAVKNSGTFKLSGSPTFSDEDADIYLASGKKINITGALNNPTPYSVSTAATPRAGSPVEITNSNPTTFNDKTKFTPVNSSYIVRKNNNDQLELAVPANPCTVTFDFNDGVTAPKTVIYEKEDKYDTLPTPPARTGYIFKGWYDGDENEVTEDTTVTADCTLKAKWEECKHDDITSWTDDGNGKHTADCSCGVTVSKPHEYSKWTNDGNGKHSRSCTDCEAVETENHSYGEGVETKPATETEKGEKTYTCTVCGATKTEEIPATGGNSSDNNDPTGGNDDPTGGNGAGNVNIGSSSSESAPAVSMDKETSAKLKEEIIAEHLTDEEKAAVANGDSLDVILVVEDAGDTVPAKDKQVTEAVLTDTEYTVGMYLNIDLIKLINGVEVGKITEINSPIRVTIEIPEELRSANREFAIVRVHNEVAEILEDVDDDPDTITILTDRFSTYSIAYQDTDAADSDNPNTGVATPIAMIVLASAITATAVIVRKRR